ncbi:24611_t:CDS:2, partial [Dentiscutata erythropus]
MGKPKANNGSDEESSNQSVIEVEVDGNIQDSDTDNDDFSTKNEISFKRDIERHNKRIHLSHNGKKRKTVGMNDSIQSSSQASTYSTSNETLEESTIDQDQFSAIETSSSLSNTNHFHLTSSSRTPLNTLQHQNINHRIQNISQNNTIEPLRSDRRSQNSDRKLRNHTTKSSTQTEESNILTKRRSLKMPNKVKLN